MSTSGKAIPPTASSAPLSPSHLAQLSESGIDAQTARHHGFRTITTWQELEAIGFSKLKAKRLAKNLPGLVVPSWGADGKIAGYQVRLDNGPLVGGKRHRRPLRYVEPDGAIKALDFGRDVSADDLGNPRVPLFIVEGVKKAVKLRDELTRAQRRAVVIGISGVWGWKLTNERGGKIAHPAFTSGPVALNDGRLALLLFDSDVWSTEPKAATSGNVSAPEARLAAKKLADLLRSRGAVVQFAILPSLEDGAKQGIDDFFHAGGKLEDLQGLLCDKPPEPLPRTRGADVALHDYTERDGSTYYLKMTKDGPVDVLLANFTARIEREVVRDDGAETVSVYEVVLRCNGREDRLQVPAASFAGLSWIRAANAIVAAGPTTRDHLRAAIQNLSAPQLEVATTYSHTGWRQLDGAGWAFLHGNGAIAADGPVNGVDSTLGDIAGFGLPTPSSGDEQRHSLRSTLALLDLAPLRITAPVFGAIYRAPLGGADFTVHITGPTGAFKSQLAALAQQHFGSQLDALHLPGSWESTDNALEVRAFLLKDVLFVIDDFVPRGTLLEQQRIHAKAARILRAQGNHSGRQRMRADLTLRPDRPPRGLILSTGEEVPRGESIRARACVVNVAKRDIDQERLTRCQADAARGLYSQAMAGFIKWLAPRLDDVRARHAEIRRRLRDAFQDSMAHSRTAWIFADLAAGVGWFLRFAVDAKALTVAAAEARFSEVLAALAEQAAEQAALTEAGDPVVRYLDLLSAVVTSGRGHFADADTGDAPADYGLHGWRAVPFGNEGNADIRPNGARLGWVRDSTDRESRVYLVEPDAAFAAVTKLAADQGEPFQISRDTIARRLGERNLLLRVERREDGSNRFRVRETIQALGGKRVGVYVLRSFSAPVKEVEANTGGPALQCSVSWSEIWSSAAAAGGDARRCTPSASTKTAVSPRAASCQKPGGVRSSTERRPAVADEARAATYVIASSNGARVASAHKRLDGNLQDHTIVPTAPRPPEQREESAPVRANVVTLGPGTQTRKPNRRRGDAIRARLAAQGVAVHIGLEGTLELSPPNLVTADVLSVAGGALHDLLLTLEPNGQKA